MKKIALTVVAMLLLSGSAFAFPVINWGSAVLTATDPQEAGIGANYNMKALYGVFTGGGLTGDLALRTEVYGVPTLAKENPAWATSANYVWNFDVDGDLLPEVVANLYMDSSNVTHFVVGGTEYAANWQLSGGAYEVLIPTSYLGVIDPNNFGVYAYLDGASASPDDVLPDQGWANVVPEPASMALLGFGLLGVIGTSLKKRFVA